MVAGARQGRRLIQDQHHLRCFRAKQMAETLAKQVTVPNKAETTQKEQPQERLLSQAFSLSPGGPDLKKGG